MKELSKRLLAASLWRALGRRNLVRLGRFLSIEGRLDLNGGVHDHGEPLVREVVTKHSRGDAPLKALDVGAHTGQWTEALLAACERAHREVDVYLFEPSSATYRELQKRFERHAHRGRLTFERLALSRAPGTGSLHVVHELAGSSSLHEGELAGAGRERVELSTVDDYAEQKGLDHIDLVKIDAEGHDLEVLAGARSLLTRRRIEVVQFEYNIRWVDSRHYLRDAFEMLVPLGYALGKVTRKGIEFYAGWHPEMETFREANYLACTPSWVKLFPRIRWWNV